MGSTARWMSLGAAWLATTLGCMGNPGADTPLARFEALSAGDPALLARWRAGATGEISSVGETLQIRGLAGPMVVNLPTHAGGMFTVGSGAADSQALHVQHVNAETAQASAVGPRAHYAGVYADTDAAVLSDGTFAEWLYLLRSPAAPREISWRLGGEGLAEPVLNPDGAVVISAADGVPRWRVSAPVAVDAAGKRVAVHSRLVADVLVMSVDTRDAVFPVLLDPIVERVQWLQRFPAAAPGARMAPTVVFDAARSSTVVFGGTDTVTPTNDTWRWNGTTWVPLAPGVSPPVRSAAAAAYDGRGAFQRVVLFGGTDAAGMPLADTWAWNGVTWAPLPVAGPSPRGNSAMAANPVSGEMILFDGDAITGETWSWTGAAWVQLFPLTNPPPRMQHAMAFDPVSGNIIMHGGNDGFGTDYDDTWLWNGTDWVAGPVTGPGARSGHHLATDLARSRAVLFGGQSTLTGLLQDTWEWDGTTWQLKTLQPNTPPPATFQGGMAWDAPSTRMVLFGGFTGVAPLGVSGETWNYLAARTLGSDCTTDVQCGPGAFCVDAVCCNTTCGGGSATDCQACNVVGLEGFCSPAVATITCRPSAGACDTAEQCNGTTTACPADAFQSSSVVCRSAAGACDVDELCTGTGPACPADQLIAAGQVCRGAVDLCDASESCDGASPACPADGVAPVNTVCRVAAGPCDLAEVCSGSGVTCPADGFATSAVTCRPASDVCDQAEMCTGTGAACPADGFLPGTTTCRPSAGACDTAESCAGTGAACPADAFLPASTECRASAGVCDTAESCTGTGTNCPPDVFLPASTTCRASVDVCDAAESCTGTGANCPADAFLPSSTTCRASAGACDAAESCTGTGTACPADAFLPSSAECRASAGV